jgi:hypothetical protein
MSTPEPMKSAPAARPPTSEGIDRFLTNAKVPPAACGDRLSQSSHCRGTYFGAQQRPNPLYKIAAFCTLAGCT